MQDLISFATFLNDSLLLRGTGRPCSAYSMQYNIDNIFTNLISLDIVLMKRYLRQIFAHQPVVTSFLTEFLVLQIRQKN